LINLYISPFLSPEVKSDFPKGIFAKMFLIQDLLEKYGIKEIYLHYLNTHEYLKNVFGIQGASNYFFGKNFEDLQLREKLYLIVLTFKNQYKDINRAIDGLLWQMLNEGLIKKDLFEKNFNRQICFNVYKPFKIYSYLTNTILNELNKRFTNYKEKNLNIKTTVNLQLSNRIDCLIQSEARKIAPLLRSAFVLIKKDKIIAIAGKKNSVLYKRQIGSIFKPIVYLTAFENGIKPNDYIIDKPYVFKKHGKIYKPKNYEDFFMGKTYVKNGMIYSLNNATVKLAEKVGFEKVAKTAVQMGFTTVKPYLAMPLGVIPFTPLEVAKTYTVILNNGIKKDISLINNIYDNTEKEYILFKKNEKRILSEQTVQEVKNLMKEVVKRGTARGAGLLKGTLGKTGTTNDYKDAWFLGLYKEYLGVCWVGFNSMKSMGDKASGGHTAAPIFAKVQKKFMK
jgi:penicillin-binding protein 1A